MKILTQKEEGYFILFKSLIRVSISSLVLIHIRMMGL